MSRRIIIQILLASLPWLLCKHIITSLGEVIRDCKKSNLLLPGLGNSHKFRTRSQMMGYFLSRGSEESLTFKPSGVFEDLSVSNDGTIIVHHNHWIHQQCKYHVPNISRKINKLVFPSYATVAMTTFASVFIRVATTNRQNVCNGDVRADRNGARLPLFPLEILCPVAYNIALWKAVSLFYSSYIKPSTDMLQQKHIVEVIRPNLQVDDACLDSSDGHFLSKLHLLYVYA